MVVRNLEGTALSVAASVSEWGLPVCSSAFPLAHARSYNEYSTRAPVWKCGSGFTPRVEREAIMKSRDKPTPTRPLAHARGYTSINPRSCQSLRLDRDDAHVILKNG